MNEDTYTHRVSEHADSRAEENLGRTCDWSTPGTPDVTSGGGGLAVMLPEARCAITTRLATMEDLPFIDGLQKIHSHMVGWMPRKQLERYIEGEDVLIAEEGTEGGAAEDKVTRGQGDKDREKTAQFTPSPCHPVTPSSPLGYCIGRDRYMKRDDVGIFYQLNIAPLKQRHLVGATLVKAMFERAAYGCRLFSAWCAQDIRANYFWESVGFVPLAFRTGSRAKQRIHIFWQRRVREDDGGAGATPYWFPSQTTGGAVAEDRLVLPIPPGTHWRDAKPLLLPDLPLREAVEESPKMLPGGAPVRPRPEQPKLSSAQKAAIKRSRSKHLKGVPLGKKAVITSSGFKYVDREDYLEELDSPEEWEELQPKKKGRRSAPRPRGKHDKKYMAAARELRDRYLEQMNIAAEGSEFVLPPAAHGKYDVSRKLLTTAGGTPAPPAGAEVQLELPQVLDAA